MPEVSAGALHSSPWADFNHLLRLPTIYFKLRASSARLRSLYRSSLYPEITDVLDSLRFESIKHDHLYLNLIIAASNR